MDHNAMLPWLAQAAREARQAKRRKQVHVAASLDRDQSTVARFEKAARSKKGVGWPSDADAMVAAYAEDLDISPLDIWKRAMDLWASSTPAEATSPNGLPVDPLLQDKNAPSSQTAGRAPKPRAKRRRQA